MSSIAKELSVVTNALDPPSAQSAGSLLPPNSADLQSVCLSPPPKYIIVRFERSTKCTCSSVVCARYFTCSLWIDDAEAVELLEPGSSSTVRSGLALLCKRMLAFSIKA